MDEVLPELDILYMTRVQGERFEDKAEYERLKDCYILNAEKLKMAKSDMAILHPLPRVDEINVDVDDDPRACYFKQAANGKQMRKALILKLLTEAAENPVAEPRNFIPLGQKLCKNNRCISTIERGLKPAAVQTENGLRCAYCEGGLE